MRQASPKESIFLFEGKQKAADVKGRKVRDKRKEQCGAAIEMSEARNGLGLSKACSSAMGPAGLRLQRWERGTLGPSNKENWVSWIPSAPLPVKLSQIHAQQADHL